MTKHCCALLLLASLLVAGCRRDPHVYIEMLNAEKRAIEDELYELQYEYEELERELEACRRRADGGANEGDTPATRPPSASPFQPEAPDVQVPDLNARVEPEELGPVIVDHGTPVASAIELAPSGGEDDPPPSPARSIASADGSAAKSKKPISSKKAAVRASEEISSDQVMSLTLDALATGGENTDRAPGDDGIAVLLRPRDADDRIAKAAAEVSVVLIDPQMEGDAARVARWDLTVEEVAAAIEDSPQRDGIYLQLAWPESAPEHARLHLFVRYETADGRRLEADRKIVVALPDQFSSRWTPRLAGSYRRGESGVEVARRNEAPRASSSGGAGEVEPRQILKPSDGEQRPLRQSSLPNRPAWQPYR